MKKYNATFSLEDKMRESKASKVHWLWLGQAVCLIYILVAAWLT